jgi:hypothetical protein
VAVQITSYREQWPRLLYIALCDEGPPTMDRLGTPDQGARSSPTRPLGRVDVQIELTFSLSISTYSLCTSASHWVSTSSQTNIPSMGHLNRNDNQINQPQYSYSF